MAKWWEIESAIKDATDSIHWARNAVADFYPEEAPADYDPTLNQFLTG